MTEEKTSLDIDIKLRSALRRYMDLPKLLDLLHSRALYFRRADGFSDRLEGALFPILRSSINSAHTNDASIGDADYFYRRARRGNYVSCWTMSAKESMALWQLYGGVRSSVAIATTVNRLVNASFGWKQTVYIHRVKYVDHAKVRNYAIGRYSDVLRYKNEAYAHEKELRVVVPRQGDDWESNPMDARLTISDLNAFIASVVVAPEASEEFFEAVKDLCLKYELRAPVVRSKLAVVQV